MKNLVLSGKLFIALRFIAALLYVPSVDEEAQSYYSICEFPHMSCVKLIAGQDQVRFILRETGY